MSEPMDIFKFFFIISLLVWLVYLSSILIFYFITIKKWKKIDGIVLESDVKYHGSVIDSDQEGWEENVVYKYSVNSVDYQNDCITKNLSWLLPFNDFKRKYNYKQNQKIEITYNPKNPKKSILDPKFDYNTIFIPLAFYTILYYFIFHAIAN